MLSYTPNTIDSWKPAFERKISMTQVMEVDGFGQSPLTIELEFQQQVSNFLVRTAVHVAAAFTALLASIALLFKRRPPTALPPRADEPEGREPSASTR